MRSFNQVWKENKDISKIHTKMDGSTETNQNGYGRRVEGVCKANEALEREPLCNLFLCPSTGSMDLHNYLI